MSHRSRVETTILGKRLTPAGAPDVLRLVSRCRMVVPRGSGERSSVPDGTDGLRSFSSWVHDRIGHTGPEAAQPLVDFDDELDARNTRGDREYDTRAVGLAAAFLAETSGSADDAP
jgi:hypothetical protein